jgi:hypothetical protein
MEKAGSSMRHLFTSPLLLFSNTAAKTFLCFGRIWIQLGRRIWIRIQIPGRQAKIVPQKRKKLFVINNLGLDPDWI